jgi:hypothetical protein
LIIHSLLPFATVGMVSNGTILRESHHHELVQRWATGWAAEELGFHSRQHPDRHWGPASLLSSGYRELCLRGKAAGAWSRPLTSNAEVENSGAIPFLACFPYFENKRSLWDHLTVFLCIRLFLPICLRLCSCLFICVFPLILVGRSPCCLPPPPTCYEAYEITLSSVTPLDFLGGLCYHLLSVCLCPLPLSLLLNRRLLVIAI